jgi:hypothetical protein
MNRDRALDAFLRRIVARAYTSVIRNKTQLLEKGPIERNPNLDELKLHTWYKNLGSDNQTMVQQIISETAFSALFGCLVILDNNTTGYAVEDEISDFGLFVQRYSDAESYANRKATESIQINDLMDLHDALREHINK